MCSTLSVIVGNFVEHFFVFLRNLVVAELPACVQSVGVAQLVNFVNIFVH